MAKILKIEICKNEDVYDITVPKSHAFYADGILVHNCCEIGLYSQLLNESGETEYGWQGCNLTEANGNLCTDKESFFKACRSLSILGTLQAGYTDFKFVTETTKKLFDREALLGCSITGWMNNPEILFDEDILKEGAKIVKDVNKQVAKLIGINPAARTTCVKPSGNLSVILGTASGIHAEHSKIYIRNIQMNKDSQVAKIIKKINPYMVEDSVWSENKTDYIISFPIIPNEKSLYKKDLIGLKHLELVKKAQEFWVNEGTNEELCALKGISHNVSNTILVDDWKEVEDYIFENKNYFAGISLLSSYGDKDFDQAPNTEVLLGEEIIKKYGSGAIFASGLVVEGLKAFQNLWVACLTVRGFGDDINQDNHENLLKKDWVRRFKKFAENYFDNDLQKTEYCLKDVYLFHKWEKIQKHFENINWIENLTEVTYIDIDTMGSAACVGGGCEI